MSPELTLLTSKDTKKAIIGNYVKRTKVLTNFDFLVIVAQLTYVDVQVVRDNYQMSKQLRRNA